MNQAPIKARRQLGKYRIQKRLGQGGFATVYSAFDTIEGVPVALKIPSQRVVTETALNDFRREVRIMAKLDHPAILPLKTADFIEGHFVIVYPLGERTLAERMRSRLTLKAGLSFVEQMLQALAYAHARHIVHCDVKPENFILFPGDRLRLADFGIAKFMLRTVAASGSGTIGYVAPEQALGRPSFRSDVFSAGLIIYRLFSGHLPEWPYRAPLPGFDRLKKKLHRDCVALVLRAIDVDARKRYADAEQMLSAFRRIKPRTLAYGTRQRSQRSKKNTTTPRRGKDWEAARQAEFKRLFGRTLQLNHACPECGGPVSEAMTHCPWCAAHFKVFQGESRLPARCERCHRGMKLDWRYCAWCYGGALGPRSNRSFTDKHYTHRCEDCGGPVMPFTRYCPWCRHKMRSGWSIQGVADHCAGCGGGVVMDYWYACPWCGRRLHRA